ncbi:hypothetical protein LTR36_005713 [Oleoguttula mirabilis]|uniref:Rhodopsin domain-containing protein n=1 Tax=Oleoguttula mirabilis TaxID=1507867 RepID=A0AAV9JFR7_9PEZI|nr:hypothetical protein LTR36_005713 [Oleoguttula mirabilis]
MWCVFSAIFMCIPVAAFWDLDIAGAHCLSHEVVWFINAGINIITDISIAILPLSRLKQLNIAKRQKIALMVVFALGGFTCVVSILRLESIYALTTGTDANYNGGQAALWSSLEVNVGIVCSCLPTLKTLATRYFPKMFTTYRNTHGSADAVDYPYTSGAYGYSNGKGGITHVELGRGLTGRREPIQHAHISRGSPHSIDINLDDMGTSPKEIKVVTVVDQEVESRQEEAAKSEHGSERHLVYRN